MITKSDNVKIILASGSPRRRELLEKHGVVFETLVTDADESICEPASPQEVVNVAASRKAEVAAAMCGNIERAVIIAADTIVYINGKILGKPKDKDDAVAMLKLLAGNWHRVYTGMCIAFTGGGKTEFVRDYCITGVKFKPLTDSQIERYIKENEPYDKAGAYAVQDTEAGIIEKIDGDYENVVGLPVARVLEIIAAEGIII